MPELSDTALILITFGGLFIIGLIADLIGRHTPMPRVTLLILTGFFIGPSVLNWLPSFANEWFPILTNIALAMIGFILGQNLTKKKFSTMGRPIIGISLGVMIMTAVFMFVGLTLLGAPIEMAIILAGIATATAPAPVVDVSSEINARGPFTDTLLGIVAVDDAWGLLLFSFLLIVASIVVGNGQAMDSLHSGMWEIFGAIILGLILGFPMAYLTSHLYPGKSSQAEVLGLVLLCAGLAEWIGASYILTAMVMGAVVANFSKHHQHRPFHEVEAMQWPLLILFFLLAGSELNLTALLEVGAIGVGYIILRILGRISGSFLGAKWAKCDQPQYHLMGLAMLPHAGVAIGMALLAIHHFPELKESLMAIILGACIFFELIGPAITRMMIIRAGEARLDQ